jgi:hypothetical protein
VAITFGAVRIIPLSIQADPGMVGVRLLACQTDWEPADLEAKRFTLRSGHLDFHALPLRVALPPYTPVEFRLDFPVQVLSEPLTLRCSRGLFQRQETLDLLRQPLYDPEERRGLDEVCRVAWFERAHELELAYDPRKLRTGELHLDEAAQLIERYLQITPSDEHALQTAERVRLKKDLARALYAGDWLRIDKVNVRLRELQSDWKGPEADDDEPLEAAYDALKNGWLEAAEARLVKALADREMRAEAVLLLARMAGAWRRDLAESAHRYVEYFEFEGPNEDVAREALDVMAKLGGAGVEPRGRMLELLSERLVMRPNDLELADLVYEMAEAQAAAGGEVLEDFALLWSGYERAFEHAVAIERRADRALLLRLERLHRRLGNDEDWLRVRRALADLEPWNQEYREELARQLAEKGRLEEALDARMALWLTTPADAKQTGLLAETADAAGMRSLAARARHWLELLHGAPRTPAGRLSPETPTAMLLHPELRPLESLLLSWEQDGVRSDRAALERALLSIERGLATDRRRALEAAAKERSLVPALEASLMVRDQGEAREEHPLRMAARLSLDRLIFVDGTPFAAGVERLGLWEPDGRPLFAPGLTRLAAHRLRELGKFYLSRLWEEDAAEFLAVSTDAMAGLVEAFYLQGLLDHSTRGYLHDAYKRRRLTRRESEKLENQVLRYLRLAPGKPSETTEF